ncbi:MAG: hypothetical protein JNK43_10625 [Ignavibacteria bacterium]|nr:hypothetical protein [Ignavibacteria bacterium]
MASSLFSQDDSIKNTAFSYYDYSFNIESNTNNFYTGRLNVSRNGKSEFSMDSVFSDYVEHCIIDMDGDGKKELLLSVSEGASPYVFNCMYIFDAGYGPKPRFYITNAYLDTTEINKPAIDTFVRMSPSVMGLSYRWQMFYDNGRLKFNPPGKKNLYAYGPDFEEVRSSIKEIWPSKVDCDDYTYTAFFDYIFINSKIAGNIAEAEDFFNSEYKCPNKVSSLIRFKTTANETLDWIKDEKNYLFSEY